MLTPSYWLKCQHPLIGQQLILVFIASYFVHNAHSYDQQLMIVLLVYMPSDWSKAHLSLNTLLLAYMPSDWSIANPCLSTLLL